MRKFIGFPPEQSKVALLLANGYTKKEIAARLNKSVSTINNQAQQIYDRTGAANLADLTRKIIDRLIPGADVDKLLSDAIRNIVSFSGVAIVAIVSSYFGYHIRFREMAGAFFFYSLFNRNLSGIRFSKTALIKAKQS